MRYSDEQLARINQSLRDARRELETAFFVLLSTTFVTDRGREFAQHGVGRRIKMIARTLDATFEIIPPTRTKPLSEDEGIDVERNIHSAIIATAGTIDNLAWLWVSERNLKRSDGSDLRRSEVGFREKQVTVRKSLPDEIVKKLSTLEGWMRELENYRDALAHRIPPYVARYSVYEENTSEYVALIKQEGEARLRRDGKSLQQILRRLSELTVFSPTLQHSFSERTPSVLIHGMLIVNSRSTAELTLDFLNALRNSTP